MCRFRMAGGCAGLDVVVDAESPDALLELLFLQSSISLCLDLCLALAVGGFGLLEDADKVLALEGGQQRLIEEVGGYRRLTLLTTLPDLLITVMVSPTPIVAVQALFLQMRER